MGQVEGKIALVTGGASGIGAACAETLAREGARVVVSDIDDLLGNALVGQITAAGGDAIYLSHDVTDEARWQAVVGEIDERYGRLDILVANAGIGIMAPSIVEMSLADWRRQTAVNLDGVFLSVKFCIPLMRRSGGGSIIMTSSIAGLRGSATLAGYCATKGGVRLFAKAIAMECASRERRHPRQLGASRHHRHADLGQDPARRRRAQRADRHRGIRAPRRTLGPRRQAAGHRQRRPVSRFRCGELHHRRGARHRRRDHRRPDHARRTAGDELGA